MMDDILSMIHQPVLFGGWFRCRCRGHAPSLWQVHARVCRFHLEVEVFSKHHGDSRRRAVTVEGTSQLRLVANHRELPRSLIQLTWGKSEHSTDYWPNRPTA
ncbi:hypothetical protein DPEC_G00117030 [Dallia pectoralis]|uniref:Uncharacterized protein n=1 Tax=Dallia pectoralis TaxID=75939 RepID=A0ACC2GUZ7_DALPE|nr:hypothetical protein DPEC_G00117030 [Dallia pectoralis]